MASSRPGGQVPPLRTFKVRRPNYEKTPIKLSEWFDKHSEARGTIQAVPHFTEQAVECHRIYTDTCGSLCFEMLVWDDRQNGVTSKMPMCMAPGTWMDAIEITADLLSRPSNSLQ